MSENEDNSGTSPASRGGVAATGSHPGASFQTFATTEEAEEGESKADEKESEPSFQTFATTEEAEEETFIFMYQEQ